MSGDYSRTAHSSSSDSRSRSAENGHGRKRKLIRLYYTDDFRALAEEVVNQSTTNGASPIELCEIDWHRFDDGFPNVYINGATDMNLYHVAFLMSLSSPNIIFERLSVATFIPRLMPKSFKLILPFFPTGTMERVERPGEVATANTLAQLLSTIPHTARGPAQIIVYDIHALPTQFYFRDSVIIRLDSALSIFLDRLKQLPDAADHSLQICFPDDGAHKRFATTFHKSFDHPVVCNKVRGRGGERQVNIKEGEVKDKHVIIVDDLVQSGGTLIECARTLLANGAKAVSAYATHMICPNESWKKFTGDKPKFTHFFTTNTNPIVTDALQQHGAPFEVFSIAPLLNQLILDDII